MLVDRTESKWKRLDLPLLVLVGVISVIGIIMISSAVKSYDNSIKYIIVQSAALILGSALMLISAFVDYEIFTYYVKYIYGFGVLLLILVLTPLGTGRAETGGQSWFHLGFFNFQPAELVKIFFIISFSTHLAKVEENIANPRVVLGLFFHFAVLFALIMLQPDLGTALVFTFIFIVLMFACGLSYKYFLGAFGALLVASPLAWFFLLKGYQKNRILAVFNPEAFVSDYGYQVVQSKIAIGSGQLFGKGFFKGTQTQLEILPEKQTDFIFAVVGEEFGLVGCLIIIALLCAIILRCIKISKNAQGSCGRYICLGVAAMFIFQTLENIGMCIGLTPVIGITLPFLSYGGSSLLSNLLAIGLVLSVRQKTRNISSI